VFEVAKSELKDVDRSSWSTRTHFAANVSFVAYQLWFSWWPNFARLVIYELKLQVRQKITKLKLRGQLRFSRQSLVVGKTITNKHWHWMISFSGGCRQTHPHFLFPLGSSGQCLQCLCNYQSISLCVHWLYQTSFQAPISQYIMS